MPKRLESRTKRPSSIRATRGEKDVGWVKVLRP